MCSTAAALRVVGLAVTESTAIEPDLDNIDLVHGFGLNASEIQLCRRAHLPVALSTIYGPRSYRYAYAGGPVGLPKATDRIRRAAVALRGALGARPIQIAQMMSELDKDIHFIAAFAAADVLLPNAVGERHDLVSDLQVSTPCVVVPNAVDPDLFKTDGSSWQDRTYDVACVGRIEPHKNQLGLIEALRGSGLRLTIVGHDHPHHPKYAARCREAGDGWVEFVEGRPQDELPDLYRRAKVHALPSWFETTGLVSLEAALSGCAVVSTSRGYAAEYLTNFAHYCDPAKPETIRSAIKGALQAGPQAELRDRILNNYTWRHTAEATLAAYQTIMR